MAHTAIRPLVELIQLNSSLIGEAIDQFDEASASERILGGSKNSFKFVLGHMVWGRCMLTKQLAEPRDFPWTEKFGAGQSQSDGSDYPSLEELANAYSEIAGYLDRALDGLKEAEFMTGVDGVPGDQEQTVRGWISFWVWQDCYHTGQVGSILTTLGLPDIKTLHYKKKERLGS